MHKIEHNYTH